ncbi:hypothetical protein [Bacillus sp. CDB3]|uniref:hypothetical protein n=1 Tax=Bacillus sp. CDB3 TaxID=360310 RepID=UPI0009D8A7FF|nr:hypothetical protein [Bacillus sp. CDB3]OQR53372.1 hypothetical protein CDB3_30380 [Bacillus sp. CDB3]
MSLKKYVKYTSLGLALSISATIFAPSMSSAQVTPAKASTQNNSINMCSPAPGNFCVNVLGMYQDGTVKDASLSFGIFLPVSKQNLSTKQKSYLIHTQQYIQNLNAIERANPGIAQRLANEIANYTNQIVQAALQNPYSIPGLIDTILAGVSKFNDPNIKAYLTNWLECSRNFNGVLYS